MRKGNITRSAVSESAVARAQSTARKVVMPRGMVLDLFEQAVVQFHNGFHAIHPLFYIGTGYAIQPMEAERREVLTMLEWDRRSDPRIIAAGRRVVDWHGYFVWTGQRRSARAAYQPSHVCYSRTSAAALVLMVASVSWTVARKQVLDAEAGQQRVSGGFEFRHRRFESRAAGIGVVGLPAGRPVFGELPAPRTRFPSLFPGSEPVRGGDGAAGDRRYTWC
ncbi:MAG: hypothetical protein R3F40_18300 [Candidatus Competibacteraceae bacterium]